jgi:hypothetical protein
VDLPDPDNPPMATSATGWDARKSSAAERYPCARSRRSAAADADDDKAAAVTLVLALTAARQDRNKGSRGSDPTSRVCCRYWLNS